jgi:hypothetical protein
MNLPILPPRGVLVPTYLIFHPDLPPTTLRTWMQLRCLAWADWITPPMTVSELAARLGIHTTRLYRHLAQLKDISALTWRIASQGKIIISFPEEPASRRVNDADTQSPVGSAISTVGDQVIPVPPSYFPAKILGYLSYEDEEDGVIYITENCEQIESKREERTGNFSKLEFCRNEERAYYPGRGEA